MKDVADFLAVAGTDEGHFYSMLQRTIIAYRALLILAHKQFPQSRLRKLILHAHIQSVITALDRQIKLLEFFVVGAVGANMDHFRVFLDDLLQGHVGNGLLFDEELLADASEVILKSPIFSFEI